MIDSFLIWGSALFIGVLFGTILQKTSFSTTFAFWNMINFKKDFMMFRIYILSIIVAILGANILEDAGLLFNIDNLSGEIIRQDLHRQAFLPIANIAGGFIFGIGTIFASGCASSTIYRCGEGFINAWVAFFGLFLGMSTVKYGWLSPLYNLTGLYEININGKSNPALWDIFGNTPETKWITIITVIIILSIAIFYKGISRRSSRKQGGYNWIGTGICIGLIVVAAWWCSAYWGKMARGISFTGPTSELILGLLTADTMAGNAPEISFFRLFDMTWASVYVIGVPIGAFLSIRYKTKSRLKLSATSPDGLVEYFIGGCLMGIGSGISGGCNIGHGLTGVSTLALSSITTTIFIMLGTWTMFYFKVMKD